MPIVLLAHNGIGLGHLSRATMLGRAIAELDETPVLLNQSGYAVEAGTVEQRRIDALWRDTPEARVRRMREIDRFAAMFEPRVVIEDTIPEDCLRTVDVKRILIVRPTDFHVLKELALAARYDCYAISDHPNSPTWPYSQAQSEEMMAWQAWQCIGPIYRQAARNDVEALEKEFGWLSGQRIAVFTMGGGGEHEGADDASTFMAAALEIRGELLRADPQWQTIFVKGPYFRSDSKVLKDFIVVESEVRMPSLLARADLAVIRPGFNTLWECLSAGTPFLCIEGTTYQEPVGTRLLRLREQGLALGRSEWHRAWTDSGWLNAYKAACAELVVAWPGRPRTDRMATLLTSTLEKQIVDPCIKSRWSPRVLLIAIDTIGIGHVERMIEIGRRLEKDGLDVHLAIEGAPQEWKGCIKLSHSFLPRCLQPYSNASEFLDAYASLIEDVDPSCVLYDVHRPLAPWIDKMLIHRFTYRCAIASLPSQKLLGQLRDWDSLDRLWLLHSRDEFCKIYGDSEMAGIEHDKRLAFAGWTVPRGGGLGVEQRAASVPDVPFLLVVLGGGGEHRDSHDTEEIARAVNDLAMRAMDQHGLITVFIGGPHFKHGPQICSDVILHVYVQNIDEFMERAEVVVLRPGFNSIRKAMLSAKRIVLLKTKHFEEAALEHAQWLESEHSILSAEIGAMPDTTLEALKKPANEVSSHLTDTGLTSVCTQLRSTDFDRAAGDRFRAYVASLRGPLTLLIRIDDVAKLDKSTTWLLRLLASRRLAASLEVMPYHVKFDERDLDHFDSDTSLFEVSQHGFSHLSDAEGCEPMTTKIVEGQRQLARLFPTRFKHGYSAPYDRLPPGGAAFLKNTGYSYLSTMDSRIATQDIPLVRLTTDLWSWTCDRPRSLASNLSGLASAWARGCPAGLVLHPYALSSPDLMAAFERLLSLLDDLQVRVELPSAVAARQANTVDHAKNRRYHQ